MRRRLIIMRHAKSAWDQPGMADHDRPLNDRGQRTAPRMAQLMTEQNIAPEIVLASTAVRVQQTLQYLLAVWGHEPQLHYERALYLASCGELLRQVGELPAACTQAMLVGHNPGLSELVTHLLDDLIELPTAAVAVCDCDADSWSAAVRTDGWRKAYLWIPKEL